LATVRTGAGDGSLEANRLGDGTETWKAVAGIAVDTGHATDTGALVRDRGVALDTGALARDRGSTQESW